MRRSVWVVALPLMLGVAFAAGGEDPATRARKELESLDAKAKAAPSSSTPGSLAAAASAIDQSKKALARAGELRALGDVPRAELAEDAALDWALAARDLVSALDLERKADDQAAAAASASTKAARARALLDAAIDKRAKLQAELDQLEKDEAARALDAGPPPTPSAAKKKPKPKGKP